VSRVNVRAPAKGVEKKAFMGSRESSNRGGEKNFKTAAKEEVHPNTSHGQLGGNSETSRRKVRGT